MLHFEWAGQEEKTWLRHCSPHTIVLICGPPRSQSIRNKYQPRHPNLLLPNLLSPIDYLFLYFRFQKRSPKATGYRWSISFDSFIPGSSTASWLGAAVTDWKIESMAWSASDGTGSRLPNYDQSDDVTHQLHQPRFRTERPSEKKKACIARIKSPVHLEKRKNMPMTITTSYE